MDDDGKACLCDFGLSNTQEVTGPAFETAGTHASARWMAPEFIREEGQTFQRTQNMDVFSFGCVAFEVRFSFCVHCIRSTVLMPPLFTLVALRRETLCECDGWPVVDD